MTKGPSFSERRFLRKMEAQRSALGYGASQPSVSPNDNPAAENPPERSLANQRAISRAVRALKSVLSKHAMLMAAAALVAASILLHALVMRPPRYQIVHLRDSQVGRLDRRTGEMVLCYNNDGEIECEAPEH